MLPSQTGWQGSATRRTLPIQKPPRGEICAAVLFSKLLYEEGHVEPGFVEVELEGRGFELGLNQIEIVAGVEEADHLGEHLVLKRDEVVAVLADLGVGHLADELREGIGRAEHDPDLGFVGFDGEFVELLHGTVAALDPEGGAFLVVKLHDAGDEGDVFIVKVRADLEALAEEDDVGEEFQDDVLGGLQLGAANDELLRQLAPPVITAQIEIEFAAHASSSGRFRAVSCAIERIGVQWVFAGGKNNHR